MNKVLGILCACALAAATACTTVQTTGEYSGGPLPRPERVIVYDFAVSPDEVKLDRGISARVFAAAKGEPRLEQEIEIGRKVASALSEKLVKEIREMGLVAYRAADAPTEGPDELEIQGHFLSIDEGNRTARVVIGLGMGRTKVEAEVQVYQNRRLVEQFETDAKSGLKPGAAETMGIGAAAGTLGTAAVVAGAAAVGSEAFSANVEADASRTARKLADELSVFFVRQGWISQ